MAGKTRLGRLSAQGLLSVQNGGVLVPELLGYKERGKEKERKQEKKRRKEGRKEGRGGGRQEGRQVGREGV